MKFFVPVICLSTSLHALLPVGVDHIKVVDPDRKKVIEVDIAYPSDGKDGFSDACDKYPLILLSHGWGVRSDSMQWLADYLASDGFIVAAPQHKDFESDGRAHIKNYDRPLDVTAVLTELLTGPMKSHIDPDAIGVAGYSLGGMTAVWLVGGRAVNYDRYMPTTDHTVHQFAMDEELPVDMDKAKASYRDDRIKAAFLMAPAWAWVFDEVQLKEVDIPVAIVVGEKDEVIVPATNSGFFASHIPHAQYHVLHGEIGHFIFLHAKPVRSARDRIFFMDHPSVDRTKIHQRVGKMATDFFDEELKVACPVSRRSLHEGSVGTSRSAE